jgi:hypothetical protein
VSQEISNRYFDELASGLASGSISRGRALRLMGAALVGGTLASLGIGEAAADPPGCKRNGKKCTRDTQCCSGNCEGGTCAAVGTNLLRCICNDTNISRFSCHSEDCNTLLTNAQTICDPMCASAGGFSGSAECRPDNPECGGGEQVLRSNVRP